MTRLFMEESPDIGNTVTIIEDDFEHLRALRMRTGEIFELCNPITQVVYNVKLEKMTKDEGQAIVLGFNDGDSEPATKITLFQAIPKLDKMELIIQKSVELGITKIVPMFTSRVVTHPANAG
ncbi:MAG: 16S rRNA (uracil(1498)-N(3))-methyltransferase, partial [Defluviitaleaceae bacterium]|nr:16S rRNA (uracil(1498)-N(3))-methyltransferase [Defluviitaleaceae bacterium]